MKFKDIAAAVLAGALAFSLFACSKTPAEDGTETSGSDTAPTYDYSAGLTEDGHFKGVKATDYVTLPQYKGVSVPASILVPSEDALQETIDDILSNYTDYEKVYDREVKNNDTVNIDYVGKIDGKEFDGGSTKGKGTDVTIGVTAYIDGFLDQLVGHKPGETFDITVTFPEQYEYNTELSGKEAVFTVTINYIQGAPLPMELTDEIATEYGFQTTDELIDDIKKWVVSKQKLEFYDSIMSGAQCSEIPSAIIDYIKNSEIAYYEDMALMYGMDVDSLMNLYLGYESLQAYLDMRTEYYNEAATDYLIAQAIAEQEGIKVTTDDIKENGYEDYITTYGEPYLKLHLLSTVIVPDFVIENGVKTED